MLAGAPPPPSHHLHPRRITPLKARQAHAEPHHRRASMTEPSRILRSTAAWLAAAAALAVPAAHADYLWLQQDAGQARAYAGELRKPLEQLPALEDARQDRKSTRLNSSHSQISDALFCF